MNYNFSQGTRIALTKSWMPFSRHHQNHSKGEKAMQSKQAIQTQAESTQINKATTNPFLVEAEKIFDRMKELYQAIERRAYDFFAERGYEDGQALDDWVRAESELLMNVPVTFSDDESHILVHAEVPGFAEKDIQVSVEPHRLAISGKVEHIVEGQDEGASTEKSSREFFCSFDLPYEVEPSSTKTALNDGILEISLPRLSPKEQLSEEVKQA
jgi:HSP20 family protein